jgi:hypothetical protein
MANFVGIPTVRLEATPATITEGGDVLLRAVVEPDPGLFRYIWTVDSGTLRDPNKPEKPPANPLETDKPLARWSTATLSPGSYTATVSLVPKERLQKGLEHLKEHHIKFLEDKDRQISDEAIITVTERPISKNDTIPVTMRRALWQETNDLALWVVIRNSTQAISFLNYKKFIEENTQCLSQDPKVTSGRKKNASSSTPFPFVDSYKRLQVATEVFLMAHCGVAVDFSTLTEALHDVTPEQISNEETIRFSRPVDLTHIKDLWNKYLQAVNADHPEIKVLPYLELIINNKLGEVPLTEPKSKDCYHILMDRLTHPCLMELIWSYWHEEGMLVQTLNAISLRFQNRLLGGGRDPLARLDLDPLRPLNNLFWGHIQDEQHRLTLARRAYEYDHHYGLPLRGKAVPRMRAADSRFKFLEAFNNLLYVCTGFFNQDDDMMVVADGFPVLNALKEVHILLAEGAHNQFGDLPSTARMEMLMQQWLLARPEMREFLSGRVMVPYTEPWMDRVDTMKKLQGWTDASIIHFHRLAVFGEQLLLSIRYGSWNEVDHPEQAANWARYWRAELQGYTHAYRTVTGVDLTTEATDPRLQAVRHLPPSVHLARRLAMQMRAQ